MSMLKALKIRYYNERIDPDELYHILSNPRRRAVLQYLFDHEDEQPVALRELVDHLVERGIGRDAAYVSLYQSHLPKLNEYGMIDYNSDRGLVSITRRGVVTTVAHRQLRHILEEDT